MYALLTCSLWLCNPPLYTEIRIELCQALKVTMAVPGIRYECKEVT